MQQQIQLMKPEALVRLTNQLKTTKPELPQLRYMGALKREKKPTA
jgi:hypothetical protein